MTGPKIRKKTKPKATEVTFRGSWGEALEESVKSLQHGGYAVLHTGSCPASGSGVCDCPATIMGPALRNGWQ